MPLVDTISAFRTGTYTVTRTPEGTFVDGFEVPAVPTTFPIDASVRPVGGGRTLRRSAEGQYGDEVRRVRTETELRTRTPTMAADRIAIEGEVYEVFRVRFNPITRHYHALVSRLNTP
jgi:hypothetical protein